MIFLSFQPTPHTPHQQQQPEITKKKEQRRRKKAEEEEKEGKNERKKTEKKRKINKKIEETNTAYTCYILCMMLAVINQSVYNENKSDFHVKKDLIRSTRSMKYDMNYIDKR